MGAFNSRDLKPFKVQNYFEFHNKNKCKDLIQICEKLGNSQVFTNQYDGVIERVKALSFYSNGTEYAKDLVGELSAQFPVSGHDKKRSDIIFIDITTKTTLEMK